MLEATHPRLATEVHYVAGDRVVADPLCKPFSMGRNLFCVHSKKHMDDDMALRDAKIRTNRQTVVSMSRQLSKVPCCSQPDGSVANLRAEMSRYDPSRAYWTPICNVS